MLSDSQLDVLQQLEELGNSSLSISDQKAQVTAIDELLQTLEDKARYEQLITASRSNSSDLSFIALCRQRLISAQQKSLNNYNLLRDSKTKRTEEIGAKLGDSEPQSDINDPASLEQNLQESKSEEITQVLQRMHEMAQGEVLKGELNISELDMSSRTLRELQEKYSGVDILLNGSKRLVKILDAADKWDRRCMQASLGFLALVMCYIIYRRILAGPIRLLIWSLLKLVGIAKLFDMRTPSQPSMIAVPVSSIPVSSIPVSSIPVSAATPTIVPRVGGIDPGHSITFSPHGDVENFETSSEENAEPSSYYTEYGQASAETFESPVESMPESNTVIHKEL